jgi:hypothetical protein
MKYIKLFEDIVKYHEISENDYENGRKKLHYEVNMGNIDFDESDIKYMKDSCDKIKARLLMRGPTMQINLRDGRTSLMIYKTVDDWFFVKVRHPHNDEIHYECDQIDSLSELLHKVNES